MYKNKYSFSAMEYAIIFLWYHDVYDTHSTKIPIDIIDPCEIKGRAKIDKSSSMKVTSYHYGCVHPKRKPHHFKYNVIHCSETMATKPMSKAKALSLVFVFARWT